MVDCTASLSTWIVRERCKTFGLSVVIKVISFKTPGQIKSQRCMVSGPSMTRNVLVTGRTKRSWQSEMGIEFL
jgi:hypothetical protein